MAVHPLRPATYLRLGEPLPHQLTNRTQSSLLASLFIKASCETLIISSLISCFHLLSQTKRQVLYALLTRPPWLSRCKHRFPIDLHVLSILSAFILSQDQTLHSIYFSYILFPPLSWRVSCLQGKCSWLLFISYTLLLLLFLSSIVLRYFFVSTRYILSYPLPFVNYFFHFFKVFFIRVSYSQIQHL